MYVYTAFTSGVDGPTYGTCAVSPKSGSVAPPTLQGSPLSLPFAFPPRLDTGYQVNLPVWCSGPSAFPQNSCVEILIPKGDGVRRWDLWEGGALRSGISVLTKDPPTRAP